MKKTAIKYYKIAIGMEHPLAMTRLAVGAFIPLSNKHIDTYISHY